MSGMPMNAAVFMLKKGSHLSIKWTDRMGYRLTLPFRL